MRTRSAIVIAIGADRIVARALGAPHSGSNGFRWARALRAGDDGDWRESVCEAFAELRAAVPSARVVHVALMPPIAEVRIVDLPTAGGLELRRAIERDAAKYFPIGTERQIAQVGALNNERGAAFAPHVLSVAPEQVVDAVLAAAQASHWTVASLAPAARAWVAAALAHPDARPDASIAVVRSDDRVDILHLQGGELKRLQRRRQPAADALPPEALMLAQSTDAAFDIAARFARARDDQSLWPERVYADRDRRTWRQSAAYAIAATLALCTALGVEWFAAGRELTRIGTERATLRPRVAAALAARDSLDALGRRLTLLRTFGASAPQWSAVIGTVAHALPEDASLISMGVFGDTLIMVGEAERAAGVFASLGQAPSLTRVRAHAPIQQQVEDGEVVVERFTIAAQLTNGGRR